MVILVVAILRTIPCESCKSKDLNRGLLTSPVLIGSPGRTRIWRPARLGARGPVSSVCDSDGGSMGTGRGAAVREIYRTAAAGGGLAQPLRRPACAGGQRVGGIDADARHGSGECGRHRVLADLERGEVDSGGAGLYPGDHAQRADGAAGIDWASRTAPDGGGA